MAAFEIAVSIILDIEGSHSFDRLGGDTVWGIAKNYHPNVSPWPPNREQAIQIYRSEYWEKYHCGDLPLPIGIALFDAVVNQPAAFVIAELQSALHVDPDGIVGPETIAAARFRDPMETVAVFFAGRAIRYVTASAPEYQHGLLARLFRVQRSIISARV